ncbi:MAG: pyruvate kinase [Hyphomonadaceae bacterium]|nr:MAG: pyruvate kinase [Hyphomonadaceae bacterium]KAF0187006.1 MAG: pyruvate kinase [Hyphomonadaceae bacterium]
MIRNRRTRIVATLGPASRAPETTLALAKAGVDVFRLNFSHGTYSDHKAAFESVRAAEAAVERPLGILADLQGPKLRLGAFKDGMKIKLNAGDKYRLELGTFEGDETRGSLPQKEIFDVMKVGLDLLIDDGKVRLRVTEHGSDWANVECIRAGTLSDRKGVNVPNAVLPLSALSVKDRADLDFALEIGVDWVALSFVQRAEDMAELRKLVDGRAACLAKIEKPAALESLEEILDHCDGVMVARGDLGVELAPEEVPIAQKTILRAARRRGVPTIVATQMLESMITSSTPTRAEASDVANAVYEGTDALMLSAETASGEFPLEAVEVMSRIAARVERDPRWPELMDAEHANPRGIVADAVSAAARVAADASGAKCLVAFTARGATALRIARERPLQPILALTPYEKAARKLALVWGMESRVITDPKDVEDMAMIAAHAVSFFEIAKSGERIVIIAGLPFGTPGGTNLLRITNAE